jgi:tRNA(Ile)-lysidine synthase
MASMPFFGRDSWTNEYGLPRLPLRRDNRERSRDGTDAAEHGENWGGGIMNGGVRRRSIRDVPGLVDDVLASVTAACRLDALARGPLLVAVSGGGDSMALLHTLHCGGVLPRAAGERSLVVAHADHSLRPQSADDRAFVEAACERFGLRCLSERLTVRPQAGEGLEAAARRVRLAFLYRTAGSVGARSILLAHTRDDQAETVLHRLCRGTGVGGLGGMAPVRELVEGMVLVRPLLGVSRESLRRYLETMGESWIEDVSNGDTRRARNHLRHEILPRLVDGPYPAATEAICRLADHARRTARLVRAAAARALDSHVRLEADRAVVELGGWAADEADFLPEVFVEIWKRLGWPRRDMTADDYSRLADQVLRLSRSGSRGPVEPMRPLMLPGHVRIIQESDLGGPGRLVVRRVVSDPPPEVLMTSRDTGEDGRETIRIPPPRRP